MADLISVVIPNRNAGATIGRCLAAVFSSNYPNFEVIVVDDCSEDDSVQVIRQFPCHLLLLKKHLGAARARNLGAAQAKGDILFFTDADCLVQAQTLDMVSHSLALAGPGMILGGTYTPKSYDKGFFNHFQSVFVHYSETKCANHPDYIATHAMAMYSSDFVSSGGFADDFLPILEDVEFSHRLRRLGFKLRINQSLQVQHIFGFSLKKSLVNAWYKSTYWTLYSIKNMDLLADSGTASKELKINVLLFWACLLVTWVAILTGQSHMFAWVVPALGINFYINRRFLVSLYQTGGSLFSLAAIVYYFLIYPLPVSIGAAGGILLYLYHRTGLRTTC